MRVERRDGYVLVLSRWVVAPGASATTFGRFIFMRHDAVGDERLLRHELVHVAQYRADGFVRFLARYLVAYLRWRLRRYPHWAAYRRIPYEIEADWHARRASTNPSAPEAMRVDP